MLLFSKKLLDEKMFKTSFPLKKGYIHFHRQTGSFPSKETCAPEMVFCRFLRKLLLFFKKLLNNKLFNTSFMIKKVMLIFGARRLLSLENCQMHPKTIFSENTAFFEIIVE